MRQMREKEIPIVLKTINAAIDTLQRHFLLDPQGYAIARDPDIKSLSQGRRFYERLTAQSISPKTYENMLSAASSRRASIASYQKYITDFLSSEKNHTYTKMMLFVTFIHDKKDFFYQKHDDKYIILEKTVHNLLQPFIAQEVHKSIENLHYTSLSAATIATAIIGNARTSQDTELCEKLSSMKNWIELQYIEKSMQEIYPFEKKFHFIFELVDNTMASLCNNGRVSDDTQIQTFYKEISTFENMAIAQGNLDNIGLAAYALQRICEVQWAHVESQADVKSLTAPSLAPKKRRQRNTGTGPFAPIREAAQPSGPVGTVPKRTPTLGDTSRELARAKAQQLARSSKSSQRTEGLVALALTDLEACDLRVADPETGQERTQIDCRTTWMIVETSNLDDRNPAWWIPARLREKEAQIERFLRDPHVNPLRRMVGVHLPNASDAYRAKIEALGGESNRYHGRGVRCFKTIQELKRYNEMLGETLPLLSRER